MSRTRVVVIVVAVVALVAAGSVLVQRKIAEAAVDRAEPQKRAVTLRDSAEVFIDDLDACVRYDLAVDLRWTLRTHEDLARWDDVEVRSTTFSFESLSSCRIDPTPRELDSFEAEVVVYGTSGAGCILNEHQANPKRSQGRFGLEACGESETPPPHILRATFPKATSGGDFVAHSGTSWTAQEYVGVDEPDARLCLRPVVELHARDRAAAVSYGDRLDELCTNLVAPAEE